MAETTETETIDTETVGPETGGTETTATETTTDQSPSDAQERAKDYARMRRIGSWHGAAVLAALTLWGAGNFWAVQSGLIIAQLVALGNALVAGTVLASIFHEWGHFLGARMSGSRSPVLKKPTRLYFMFNFDMQANNASQFHWMSVGGVGASWLAALLIAALIPLGSLSGALLLAVVVGKAVNASFFEVPIIQRTRNSGEPQQELQAQLASPGLQKTPGAIAGVITWIVVAFPGVAQF